MELAPSSKYLARRDESIDDHERESLSQRLATEFEAGRLESDEYRMLLDQLYDAKTLGELVPVVKAVPDVTTDTPDIVGTGTGKPGELSPISTKAMQPIVLAGSAIGLVLILIVVFLLVL